MLDLQPVSSALDEVVQRTFSSSGEILLLWTAQRPSTTPRVRASRVALSYPLFSIKVTI